jgi:hypothetical protein
MQSKAQCQTLEPSKGSDRFFDKKRFSTIADTRVAPTSILGGNQGSKTKMLCRRLSRIFSFSTNLETS